MKLLILSVLLSNVILAAEPEASDKYKWIVVTEEKVDEKTTKEEQDITNKNYVKIDDDVVCEVEKEHIRKKFEIYPNLRGKRMTCNNLGRVFFLNTACLKSEKIQIPVSMEQNKFSKNLYYIRCELN